jgi:phage terminase large subunit GpA-like protein
MLLDQLSIHAWIELNQIKTESGQSLDFHTHRYLYDIYRDNSKFLCCTKAGQIGFSTMAILKTIWLSRNRHIDVGYILPTVDMVQKFVGSKVNRMAQKNPVIQGWMKDKDSITQKQIDQNYIHYLGAQTERSAIMLSLDMLVADEYNKSPQEILETYDSRLQHSIHGYKWVFSNPTIPDFGVDRFYDISDKKRWHITHSCGKTYVMDESCIDYNAETYRCHHCGGVISREAIRMGEWYDKHGEKWKGYLDNPNGWSGYWIPLWINPMMTADKICEYKRTKTK